MTALFYEAKTKPNPTPQSIQQNCTMMEDVTNLTVFTPEENRKAMTGRELDGALKKDMLLERRTKHGGRATLYIDNVCK